MLLLSPDCKGHIKKEEPSMVTSAISKTREELDAHIREIVRFHFSEETGCPFWLEKKKEFDFDPIFDIKGLNDVIQYFAPFNGDVHLRKEPLWRWHPKGLSQFKHTEGFMTGGTTGDPKLRWGRVSENPEESDYAYDYHRFSSMLSEKHFPRDSSWLYVGPHGSRRLPRGVDVLAKARNCSIQKIPMDVAWMKNDEMTRAERLRYKREIVNRTIAMLKRLQPENAFMPPVLIKAVGEYFDLANSGLKGVFAGGTEMTHETVHHIMEELFQSKVHFEPAFGNALAGLAYSRPIGTTSVPVIGQTNYAITYQSFWPKTVVRVVKEDDPKTDVEPGERGQLQIYTFTKEWFMPGFLERDEATLVQATEEHPWPGFADVGPLASLRGNITEGVY